MIGLRGRRGVALVLAALALLAVVPVGLAWLTHAAQSSVRVGEQQATFLAATASDLDPDLARMFAVAGRSSGTEWEVLAAISQVVNDHGRSTDATAPDVDADTDADTGDAAAVSGSSGAGTAPDATREATTARTWPVAEAPIVRDGPDGTRWITAMLVRDDATDLDPTASLEAAREVGFRLRDRLADDPAHRPDRSFAAQPEVYERAIRTLPVRGLDDPAGEATSRIDGAGPEGATATTTTVGTATSARGTASRIVALALRWRAGGDCAAAGLGLTPFPTDGPVNVGDRLAADGRVMTATMMGHAQVIVEVARRHGLGERAMVIAIITALQESGLRMLASRAVPESAQYPHDALVAGDNDSVGTFQQRPSMGWGSVAQLMDPVYVTEAFFGVGRAVGSSGLTKVAGWESMRPTVAAQAVQASAFPNAYAKWVPDAAGIVASILGADPASTRATDGSDPWPGITTPGPTSSPSPTPDPSPSPTSSATPGGEPGSGPSPTDAPGPVRMVGGGSSPSTSGCPGSPSGTWSGAVRELPAPGGALVAVADVPLPGGGVLTVNVTIADQVAALLEAAAADGVVLGGSGWRSTARQERLRVLNGCPDVHRSPSSSCRVPTARPGSSQHEVGLAIDFTQGGASLCGSPGCRAYGGYAWLRANAADFGLINLPSEPWHWSTTGR